MIMRPVVGLDLSLTSTGYSVGELRGTINSGHKGVERLNDISNQIENLIATNCPKNIVAVIEGYSFASRNSQAHAIGELGGVVRLTLFRLGISFIEVPPTCRAKFATGRGNASKNEVISAVSARTGIIWSGKGADDEADAFILEEMGLAVQGNARFDWPKVNLEALEKVDWSQLTEIIND